MSTSPVSPRDLDTQSSLPVDSSVEARQAQRQFRRELPSTSAADHTATTTTLVAEDRAPRVPTFLEVNHDMFLANIVAGEFDSNSADSDSTAYDKCGEIFKAIFYFIGLLFCGLSLIIDYAVNGAKAQENKFQAHVAAHAARFHGTAIQSDDQI